MRAAAEAAGATTLPAAGMIEPRGAGVGSVLGRARDLSFLLDSAAAIESALPAARGHVDWSRVGVAGHSSGAYTAMLVGDMTADMNDVPHSAPDPGRGRSSSPAPSAADRAGSRTTVGGRSPGR